MTAKAKELQELPDWLSRPKLPPKFDIISYNAGYNDCEQVMSRRCVELIDAAQTSAVRWMLVGIAGVSGIVMKVAGIW